VTLDRRAYYCGMAKRRKLRGKKLLVVSAAIASAGIVGVVGCGDDGGSTPDAAIDAPVANLIPPPDAAMDAAVDAAVDAAMDAMEADAMEAAVANLVAPPPDSGPDSE